MKTVAVEIAGKERRSKYFTFKIMIRWIDHEHPSSPVLLPRFISAGSSNNGFEFSASFFRISAAVSSTNIQASRLIESVFLETNTGAANEAASGLVSV